MEHKFFEDNLSAYLDGELPAQEKALVEAHLAGCPECSARLSQLKSVSAAVKKHVMEPVPLSLRKGALEGRRPAAHPWLKPVLALSTAAAAALIAFNVNRTQEPARGVYDAAFGSRDSGAMDTLAAPAAGESDRAASGNALEPEAMAPATARPYEDEGTAGAGLSAAKEKKTAESVFEDRPAAATRSAAAAARGAYGQAKFSARPAIAAVRGSLARDKYAATGSGALSGSSAGGGPGTLRAQAENTADKAEAAPAAMPLKESLGRSEAPGEFRGAVCVQVFNPASPGAADPARFRALAFLKKARAMIYQTEPGALVFVKNDGTRITLTKKDCAYGFILFDGVQDPLVVAPADVPDRYGKYFAR